MILTIITIVAVALLVIFGFPYIAALMFHHSVSKTPTSTSGGGLQGSESDDPNHNPENQT